MEPSLLLVYGTIALALLFNFSNGFHDSAGQVATVISSRTLSPEAALTLAALADFAGAYFFGTRVARTIGTGIIDPSLLKASGAGLYIVMAALAGGGLWNVLTWYLGMPSSSSHALIGGLVGALLAGTGPGPIYWSGLRNIVAVMLISPVLGFLLTYFFTKTAFWGMQWLSSRAVPYFKGLQVLTLIAQSLSHGTNDAQKAMGIIGFILILANAAPAGGAWDLPAWTVWACSLTMAFGVLTGGWRIIRKLGFGLYRVRQIHAFSAQGASAGIIAAASVFGFPVSTTQVISSSVMGAGAAFRVKSVRWQAAWDMVIAWLVTLPASALLAALVFKAIQILFL